VAELITTLGPRRAEELGAILPHEHVFVDLRTWDKPDYAAAIAAEMEAVDVGGAVAGIHIDVRLRAAGTMHVGAMAVTPHVSGAWEHAFDNITPDAGLTFAATGTGFTVYGVPLAQDSALIDTGLDFALGPRTRADVSYTGQLAHNVHDNGAELYGHELLNRKVNNTPMAMEAAWACLGGRGAWRSRPHLSAAALRFTILTAARTGALRNGTKRHNGRRACARKKLGPAVPLTHSGW
jgi:hypothetical protein